jgi:hypothetical protein
MTHKIGGRMKSVDVASWFAVALTGFACGGAPPPSAAPPPAAPPPAAVAVAPDMSEVPEPKNLVGILRWKNPEATLATIYAWTGVKLNAAQLASEAIDKSVAGALAFDAPIDAAVALDERGGDGFAPLTAFAVGVRSVDAARAAAKDLGTVTEIGPGEYKINLRGKRKKDKPFCMLSAAVGAAPGRFVCGERERDVESLRSYMTRTLPKRDLGPSDLHLEMRVAPVVDTYGEMINQGLHMGAALLPRKLQIGEPSFDRAIERMAGGVSDELGALLHDLDSATFDISMAPDRASGSASLRMKSQSSWSAGNFASMGTRSAPPPPMFWRLPASSTAALYEYPPEARRFEAVRNTVSELVDGWLQHDGMAAADRAAITALFADKFLVDSPVVAGLGNFAADTPAKPAAKGAPAAASDPLQGALVKAGWALVGVGTPNQVPEFFKGFASASNRPKIQTYFKDKLATATGELSRNHSRSMTGFTLKAAPVPKELPKGSLAFELAVAHEAAPTESSNAVGPRKKAAAPAPIKLQLLVVPESTQTWVAFGAEKAELVKTVLASLQPAPESGTLATRQDIASLKQMKLAEGGFFTLETMLSSFLAPATWVDEDVAKNAHGAHSLLATTPNKGKTPIFSTEEIKTGDGMTVTLRAEVPKGVIEDAVLLAVTSGLSRSRP